jgi:hypothetical protein
MASETTVQESFLPRIDNHGVLQEPPDREFELAAALMGGGRPGTVWVEADADHDDEFYAMDVLFHDDVTFGGVVYSLGDYVYVTPEEEGMPVEIGRIEQIYDNKSGGEDNIGISFRWIWRQEMITIKKKEAHMFEKNEVFWSDNVDNEQGVDAIEG